MTLTIKETKNGDKKDILVSFAKEILKISEDSTQWSNEGINTFLINLAAKTPDDEKIIVEYDEENEEVVFNHITLLFKTFADEYNKSLK